MKPLAAVLGLAFLFMCCVLSGQITGLHASGTDVAVVDLTGGRWDIEEVAASYWESITDIGPRGLQVDAAGRAHLAFGGSHLLYVTQGVAGQHVEEVDTHASGTALALDANGRPHISYIHAGELRYATWTGSVWLTQTLCMTACSEASIAVDHASRVHISYFDSAYRDLRYRYWTGSEWSTEVVDSAGTVGRWSSLALDAEGNPHVSYYDATSGHLKYAHKTEGTWHIETVDSSDWVGEYTSLVLDASGGAHIAYYDWANDRVRYAWWTVQGWQYRTVGGVGRVTPSVSLALDASGWPHVAYRAHDFYDIDYPQERMKYARWNGSSWSITDAGFSEWVFTYNSASVAVDQAGGVFVAVTHGYERAAAEVLFFPTGDRWYEYSRFDVVVNRRTIGNTVSLVLNAYGTPNIVYHTENALFYAQKVDNTWQTATVHSGPCLTGQGNSLHLDDSGRPHISYVGGWWYSSWGCDYYVYTSTALGGYWENWAVDDAIVDGSTSLDLDDAGRSYVCYEDRGWGGVKCIHWLTDTLTYVSLTTDNSADSPIVALDARGGAHVAYSQAIPVPPYTRAPRYDDALMYVRWEGTSWQYQFVDQGSDPQGIYNPSGHALVMDSGGHPHLGYGMRSSLRYARWTGSQWITQTISRGFVGDGAGFGVSLALDSEENPHIISGADKGILYAHWMGTAWAVSSVDQGGVSRQSLAVDASGNPHVLYVKDGAVKYARWTPDVTPTPRATRTLTATRTRTPTPSSTATQTTTPTASPTVGPSYWALRLEAESGAVTTPMTVTMDNAASDCYYLSTPPQLVGGQVVFTFTVPVTGAGNAKVWGRVRGLDYIHDSFFVSIDGGSEAAWPIPWQWEWRAVTNGDNQPPVTYNLTAGEHSLRIRTRESGSQIDALEITGNLSYTPTWILACGTATPSPSPTATRSASSTSTPTSTLTPISTSSATRSVTVTRTGTGTPTTSPSATTVATRTGMPSTTTTATATDTPTSTVTASPTFTATPIGRMFRLCLPLILHR